MRHSSENYDPCYPDQPVVDLYLPIWANQPSFKSKAAFVWVEDKDDATGVSSRSTLTYSQLNSSAQAIASRLLISLQRGDTVLILCPPGLQLVQIIFGCQRAGLLSVPICPPDLSLPNHHHHLIRVLSQTKPRAVISHQDYISGIQLLQNLKWVSVDDLKEDVDDDQSIKLNRSSSHVSYDGCKAEDVYLIQYTSGATGIPKPVLVTAGSAAHNVRAARKAYDLDPSSVIISWLPQYHDCGLMFLLLTVVSGATCILTSPASFVKRPRLWLELITEFKGNCTPVPSFALPLVVRRGRIDQACISPSYGLAENCTFVSTSWRKDFANMPSYKKLLPSARLSSNPSEQYDEEYDNEMDIIIVSQDTHELVEDGVEGEIWISSPSNATGYLGYPYLTSEVFQGRLQGRVSYQYVRTSDKGIVIGKERYLFVLGRCLDVITTQNYQQIHPHYLETTAYKSFPKLLRGGCIAAFQIPETIVIVAELQRSEERDAGVLLRLCEGIREAVWREHNNVEVGLVVLVKNGSVEKTTSDEEFYCYGGGDFIDGEDLKCLIDEYICNGISFRVWLDNMKANFRRCCGCWSCAADAKKLQMDVMLGGSSVGCVELMLHNGADRANNHHVFPGFIGENQFQTFNMMPMHQRSCSYLEIQCVAPECRLTPVEKS
ncbi:hypothetical protein C5167_018408 [Papaver somniferum]|uniref:AMP-dependent synthetase/ligase domain-containing protein n=1 Tax=Papaver somniferum TaxID=3469 RepID=A0A4Y7IR87_PAPSO|nr:hypothetical protein C5167_018408 [Papaver somniferum]